MWGRCLSSPLAGRKYTPALKAGTRRNSRYDRPDSRRCAITFEISKVSITDSSDRRQGCSRGTQYCRLKNWMALSCFFAATSVLKVPRFLRFPVFGSFFREYRRYSPDLSFLIMFSKSPEQYRPQLTFIVSSWRYFSRASLTIRSMNGPLATVYASRSKRYCSARRSFSSAYSAATSACSRR